MSKFMKRFTNDERDQAIKELMVSIRKNTQDSKCIDIYEALLNEVSDKEVVDSAIIDMSRFISEFLRLCHDIDNMKNVDFISKMLTYDFIQPERYFNVSRKNAKLYLSLNDILKQRYHHSIYDGQLDIILSNKNTLGKIDHQEQFTTQEILTVTKYFGDISELESEEVRDYIERARLVVLLYNYMPAIVKAFIQTKRRSFNLDKNSKKFI